MLFRPLLVKWPCSDANCGSAAATRWKRTNWLSTKHVLARVFSQTSSSNRNRNWNRWERDGVWHTDPIPGFDFLVFLKNTRFPLHKHTHKRTRERKRQSGQTSCMAKNFRLAFFIFPASDIHPPPTQKQSPVLSSGKLTVSCVLLGDFSDCVQTTSFPQAALRYVLRERGHSLQLQPLRIINIPCDERLSQIRCVCIYVS